MKAYNTYIVTKKFTGHAICGDIVLQAGTQLTTSRGYILCPHGPVCVVTSQNAYDYFSQNDDGRGEERGKLVHDILRRLKKLKPSAQRYDHIWGKIWEDPHCLKFKRPEHDDHWLWNYDFYNADIEDLKYIRNLVMKG